MTPSAKEILKNSTLIKSYEIDGMPVEIRVSNIKEPGDDKAVARFLYELLCK